MQGKRASNSTPILAVCSWGQTMLAAPIVGRCKNATHTSSCFGKYLNKSSCASVWFVKERRQ